MDFLDVIAAALGVDTAALASGTGLAMLGLLFGAVFVGVIGLDEVDGDSAKARGVIVGEVMVLEGINRGA